MAQLMDDLLELAQVVRAEIKPEAVNLSLAARSVIGRLRSQQPDRPAEVVVRDEMWVTGDLSLLRSLLDNLLSNAWRFTEAKEAARIEFGADETGGETVYCVRDNGAGFDMRYVHKLFHPFQQLHSTQEFAGTGIGLATAQRIVARHGGRIWAEGAPGEGAAFYFTLPDGARPIE